jgi:uncharacterized membrane protein
LAPAGVEALATWKDRARIALACVFAFTALAHFNRLRHDLAKMVPPSIPNPMAWVYFTGVCELAGAAGLLLPQTRELAGICLALLMVALFPANISAARRHVPLRGEPPTPLWIRAPMQILFIALALWTTRSAG